MSDEMDDDYDPLLSDDDLAEDVDDEAVPAEPPGRRADRSLELRRAIEERMEKRRLDQDLNYLELDV